ncbi:MAG TPA: pyridoxamine 5'-phosphate oxidase family protein [Trebonia sp.]|jgi:hypothetical protein|nr:pyridoxamine 5'-phosphate oxidase family protein [Trebonia sp.]
MNTFGAQPVAEPLTNDGREPSVLPWAQARQRISDARYYWLGTVHPGGQPHTRPVLAVWVGDTLYTTSSPRARKGGLPPYQPYAIRPTAVFGFVNDPALGASSTRWSFTRRRA